MELRPFKSEDSEDCLALLETGHDGFAAFLDQPGVNFRVLENDGRIVGCGGFRIKPEQATAELEWGIIHTTLRRQGVGRYLLMARLHEISRLNSVQFASVLVPMEFAGFYEKQGFRPQGVEAGLARLVKKLTVCT